ncbi:hypothetical protein KL86SPO_31683 [uncultured Sporomusa sp.]|uniref:Uncharacterized protein n=1 Tax=uncultured Sporomusa sp. TaxID=307249 RepID=A0A212LV57_9FIRM|nr:hypothetical protein KL86SPO_31683 [uncultured Sporomusa sp.]
MRRDKDYIGSVGPQESKVVEGRYEDRD